MIHLVVVKLDKSYNPCICNFWYDKQINSDTSINGEELELSGNLSDFITEEHIAAREARLTFDQERQVKFTVNADYEGECPLRPGFEIVELTRITLIWLLILWFTVFATIRKLCYIRSKQRRQPWYRRVWGIVREIVDYWRDPNSVY